ncbi:acid phosphatase [Leifsonia sp. Leaf336]|uniref:HAD family hydrolase n=1 Tax=Leifsonia sp. Leaf336 TaxID=1736341 RepID=UPI0006F44066|nr:HAD family hydrolase [Leifsonia sp. Leaf336]KQR52222.1 acid phosphatase [Leifsonia sp. Leaf336]
MTELASWRPGSTRDAITEFVEAVVEGPDAVPVPERVAVFDNDGTLWTEKPMPTQLAYIVEQWSAAIAADPGLAAHQPYTAVHDGDLAWLGRAVDKHYQGDDGDLHTLIGALVRTTAGMSVHDYHASVEAFYRDAQHLTLHRPYANAVYRPMVELIDYLEASGFSCYVVSGGDRDFMRPISSAYYGIPPERVVGSAVGLEYDADTNDVRYGTAWDFFDDGPQKPIRIWTRTGRRPILAAGNSNGDLPMLRFPRKHARSLSLLVHHDDDARGDIPYDTGAEEALAAVETDGLTVVSVRDDWSTVFVE